MNVRTLVVLVALLAFGSSTNAETLVNVSLAGAKTHPAVSMRFAGGGFVVVWSADGADGSGAGIVARVFDAAGTAVTGELLVNTTATETVGDQVRPAVAMDGAGNFTVVWQGTGLDVFARRYLPNGTPVAGSEMQVNTTSLGNQGFPAIAMAPDGRFVVAWESDQTGSPQIFAQWYDASGNPTTGEAQLTSVDQNGRPAVAMGSDGETAIAWESVVGGQKDIRVRRFDGAGTALVVEVVVNATAAGDQDQPSVSIGATGSVVVAWRGPGTGSDIFAQRFAPNGQKRDGEIVVNGSVAGNQAQPALALSTNGDFVVVWRDDNGADGSGQGIYFRRFRADGTAISPQALVNVTTALNQYDPSVAMSQSLMPQFIVAYGSDTGTDDDTVLFGTLSFGSSTTVISPSLTSETWGEGTPQSVKWGFTLAPPGTPVPTFTVTLDRDGNFAGGSCSAETIGTGLAASAGATTATAGWVVPAPPGGCVGPWPGAKVRVVASNATQDDSVGFTVASAPQLTLIRPLAGALSSGVSSEIRWNHNMGAPNVQIDLSRNGGGAPANYTEQLTASTPSQWTTRGNFYWSPAGSCDAAARCRLRACWTDDPTVCAESDLFNIASCPAINLTPPSLTGGTVGVPYGPISFVESVGAANDPDAWTVSAGSLPAGVTLSGAGVLSGTPTAAGLSSFTLRISDANLCAGTRPYSLRICSLVTVNPAGPTLASGVVGTVYPGVTFSALPAGTHTFSVTSGALPGGLTLEAASGALTGTPSATGTFNFTIAATDAGGCAGARAYSLAVTARPAVVAGAVTSYIENDAAVPIDSGLTVADADSLNLVSSSVQLTGNYQNDANGQDILACPTCAVLGISAVFTPGTATLSLSGSATVASYQAALRSVTYRHNLENPTPLPRTVTWIASDGANASLGATSTINVTPVNDAPVVLTGSALAYTENQVATAIDNGINVTDVDSANLSGATAQITSNYVAGDDVLACSGCGGIASSFSAGTLTLTGSASVAAYQAALRSVVYSNSSQNPTTAPRTVTWRVNDGSAANNLSALVASTVNVTAVNDPPVAQNKTGIAVQANMRRTGIDASLLTGVIDVDSGVNGCSPTFSIASITSGTGGTVSNVNLPAGTFDFEANAGFTGTATASYTVSDTGCPGAATSAPASISITVNGPVIWFVDDNATAGGDGRLGREFQTVGAATAAIGAGTNHKIFVYAGTYTQGAALNTDGWLIGQGVSSAGFDSVIGIAPPSGTIARPQTRFDSAVLTRPTLQSTVTMGNNSNVKGLNVSATSAAGLVASSKTGLVTSEVSVTTTTGTALSFSNASGTHVLTSVSSNGAANGISLVNTTGSFEVTGDGASDTGNTTRGRTTAKLGGGSLALGSGGTIQASTLGGAGGVLLNNAANVTLRNLTVQNGASHGLSVVSSANLSLDNVLISGHTNNSGLFGTAVAGLTLQHVEVSGNGTSASAGANHFWDVRLGQPRPCAPCATSVTGLASIANSVFANSNEHVFGLISGGASTVTFNMTNSQVSDTAAVAPGAFGLQLETWDTANVSATITGSSFLRAKSSGLNYAGNDSSGGGSISITGNVFANNGVDLSVGHQGLSKTLTVNVNNNTTRQAAVPGSSVSLSALVGGASNATTVVLGKMLTNVVGNAGVADSGSALGAGMAVETRGAGTLTLRADSNVVRSVRQDSGFYASANSGSGRLNLTGTANTFNVNTSAGFGYSGIELISGGAGGADSTKLCANLSGNTAFVGHSSAWGIGAEVLASAATIDLQGYGGPANNNGQITTYLNGRAATVTPAAIPVIAAGTIQTASTACPTPP